MSAIHIAVGQIQIGAGEAFICAGLESMSRIPMGGYKPLPNPALAKAKPGAYMGMGERRECRAEIPDHPRRAGPVRGDEPGKRPPPRGEAGRLADEIVPIVTKAGTVSEDGTIRPDTDEAALAGLSPAFHQDGSVTAGTLLAADRWRERGAGHLGGIREDARPDHLARIKSVGISGCEPETMGLGPIGASKKALEARRPVRQRPGRVEINEAFASQAIACIRDLGLKDEDDQPGRRGAIAIGHPLGADRRTHRRQGGGAARARRGRPLCARHPVIGGGQGIATVLERA